MKKYTYLLIAAVVAVTVFLQLCHGKRKSKYRRRACFAKNPGAFVHRCPGCKDIVHQQDVYKRQGLESRTPGQHVVKIVKEELTKLMGEEPVKLTFSPNPPSVYMLVGLQGAGKTTTCAKLAGLLRKEGKRPLLAACDVYRPAAVKQLQVVGGQLGIEVYAEEGSTEDVYKRQKNT